MSYHLIKAELSRTFREMKVYYPDQIVDIIIKFILFVAFFIGFGKNQQNSNSFYIGYLYWMLATYIISEASVNISFEKQVGTLEQLIIKPYALWRILIVKTIILFFVTIIKFIILMFFISFILPITISFDIKLLFICIISIVGFLGIGLALAGLTMKFAKTASFESVISYLLLFVSGTIIPFYSMPDFVQRIICFIPLAMEIDISQRIVLGYGINYISYLILIIINILTFILGYVIYNLFYTNVLTNGIVNDY